MERICVYPGSFDPITIGHMDVIRRACALFDRVIVAVLHNPAKRGCFPVEERMGLKHVRIAGAADVRAEYRRVTGAKCVVRGLRAVSDFEAEQTMAQLTAQLLPGLETVFLMTRPEHGCISSSAVREIASFGGDVSAYVPGEILADVRAHFAR